MAKCILQSARTTAYNTSPAARWRRMLVEEKVVIQYYYVARRLNLLGF